MPGSFIEENAVRLGAAAATAATSAVNGAAFDMTGFDGIAVFATVAVANAGNLIKVQQGDASNLSDAADIAGSGLVCTANNQMLMVSVIRPTKRYVRGVIIRAGSSTASGDLYYVAFKGSPQAVVNQLGASNATQNSKQIIFAGEGTA